MKVPNNDPERPITIDGTNQWTWFALIVGFQFLVVENNRMPKVFVAFVLFKLLVFILIFFAVQQLDRYRITLTNTEISSVFQKKKMTIALDTVLSCDTSFSTLTFETTEGAKYLSLHNRKALDRDDSSIFLLRLRELLGSRLNLESYVRRLAQRFDKRVELFQEDFKKRVGDVELAVEVRQRFFESFTFTATPLHQWLVFAGGTLVLQSVPVVMVHPIGVLIGAALAALGFLLSMPKFQPLAMVFGSEGIGITVGEKYINAYTYGDLESIRAVRRMNTPDSNEYWVEIKPRVGRGSERRIQFKDASDVAVLEEVKRRIALAAEGNSRAPRGSA